MHGNRDLVILGCSATKVDSSALLPAIERYDGPFYKVLRSFLRESAWPSSLSLGVLSAEHGLIGGLSPIGWYDRRMSKERAQELNTGCTDTLLRWSKTHHSVTLVLGKSYLPALDFVRLRESGVESRVVEGPIGMKLHDFSQLLLRTKSQRNVSLPTRTGSRPFYFLPDWDDLLDTDYDFENDRFSAVVKSDRNEVHCQTLMRPKRISDGPLVSLAQRFTSKGFLKKFTSADCRSLAPEAVRSAFDLQDDQWAFGDCGAFSYINEPEPAITTEQAVSQYHIHGFDFAASVDHIPVPMIVVDGKRVPLPISQRRKRVQVTRENAFEFIQMANARRCKFIPVGVIQGITVGSYAKQVPEYVEMGYRCVGIGGLVPRPDSEVLAIAETLRDARRKLNSDIWVHFFGVFRPKIHKYLRAAGVTSFDSATYFRKAWLRSEQNYLSCNREWFAAIRIPMTEDPRTRKYLQLGGFPLDRLQILERAALRALHDYDGNRTSVESVLCAICEYDLILGGGRNNEAMIQQYKRTLTERPWKACECPMCATIDVVIFRGSNRNKRRGAHNTYMLYQMIGEEVE